MEGSLTASFFQAAANYDSITETEGFPPTAEDIWILGSAYNFTDDHEELEKDVRSRLLFTYRKGFGAIGGMGPTSDFGWGCTLRCGQMMLAEALIRRHLSREWRWVQGLEDATYQKVLQQFLDRKDSCYSIHQIASMGLSEGKAVGEWFGPNTVAQVLRKLAGYDRWSGLVIHIAMDNCIIIDDIYKLCISEAETCTWTASSCGQDAVASVDQHLPSSAAIHTNSCCMTNSPYTEDTSRCCRHEYTALHTDWRPLLLVIPMRLGLTDVNPIYFDAVKTFFTIRQSVGIIGGKPNNAFWFIGYTERKLFYLDPHRVQPFIDLGSIIDSVVDDSFHCTYPSYMDVSHLDPSIAIGFYCGSQDEFDDLCQRLGRITVGNSRPVPFIEVHSKRPAHFPPAQPYTPSLAAASGMADFTMLDEPRIMDSEDEFEILM